MREISFKQHRLPPDVIRYAVWLYLRFTMSLREGRGYLFLSVLHTHDMNEAMTAVCSRVGAFLGAPAHSTRLLVRLERVDPRDSRALGNERWLPLQALLAGLWVVQRHGASAMETTHWIDDFTILNKVQRARPQWCGPCSWQTMAQASLKSCRPQAGRLVRVGRSLPLYARTAATDCCVRR